MSSPTPDHGLAEWVGQFADQDVLVVGDAVLDVWLSGPASRLCREGPVPVVEVTDTQAVPGAAANAAANLAALGARPRLISLVGDDPDGDALCQLLTDHGVDVGQLWPVPGWRTPAKRRLASGGQLVARFDETSPVPLPAAAAARLAAALCRALDCHTPLLVSDYGLGVVGAAVRSMLAEQRDRVRLLVVDAHDPRPWAVVQPTVLTPNAQEALRLLDGVPMGAPAADLAAANGHRARDHRPDQGGDHRPDQGGDALAVVLAHSRTLLDRSGADVVAVTVDAQGAVLLRPDAPPYRVSVRVAPETQTTGAGDTFTAALTLALAVGADQQSALQLASAAAQCVVQAPGTQVCDHSALLRCLQPGDGQSVVGEQELVALVERHRQEGRRIVFTNGCFDVLHTGHLSYLEQARQLGDVLLVGLNSDASVRRLKGPDRPVVAERDRAALLAALQQVDHVTIFDEDSPVRLIELVRPDIYVKGGDYTPEMLAETPVVERLGGEVRTVGYLAQRSSTRMIEQIRSGAEVQPGERVDTGSTRTGEPGRGPR